MAIRGQWIYFNTYFNKRDTSYYSIRKNKLGCVPLIEPVNRYEDGFIHSADYAIDLIKRISHENIGLLLDTFHMNIEERDICKSIINSRNYLWHVHIADSNRWTPGQGHLGFKRVIETLQDIHYNGYLSAEILPPMPYPAKAMQLTIQTFNFRAA
ncbi:sugar phosphate isomerase/epimerase [Candidatus Peregrinibacteria bacterium]|nr:sugar phosphate isomerase/epimerase [Candidatus Peregrinibacteria bacterium]